ncbi:MAG: spore coat associated protein CotJA [Clostridiaceae bacterium]|nr:spore coat associated protein CotJA [Clostridiaceae bacterium]
MIPVMPVRPQLAQAYIPYQLYNKIFSPQEALKKGTIFPELVK